MFHDIKCMVDLRLFAIAQVSIPSRSLTANQMIEEAAKVVAFIKGSAKLPEYCESIDPINMLIGELQKLQPVCEDKDEKSKNTIS